MKVFCILVVIVVVSEVAARRAATRQASPDEYQPESKAYGMPYNFGYSVYHPPSYNDYGHQETSDGKRVDGEYRVALPDGRTQIVTYYVEGNSGFQAKVRYEPTVNGPPATPYEGPESHHEVRRPVYEPVHEPRRPHYPPPYEPAHEPRRPLYPPPQESLYRPKEPAYPPAHLHKKPFYVETPTESSEAPVDEEEPSISTISPPVIDEPKSEPEPISEGRRPHDGYSENPSTKPYARRPNDYPPRPSPYPQGYVPYAQREHPQPHDGYSPKLYKQFQGDYGRRVQPHDGYSPKPNNERKEEYTPNLPHDGYSPKLYNEPKEAYPTNPYKPLPPRIAEDHPPRRLPHSGYTKSNDVSDLERQPTRPSHPRYHDGYSERHPHRELKQSVEVGERKPHTGYPDNSVTEAGRTTSQKRRRSPSSRKVRQRYVQTNLRRVKDVRDGQPSQRRLVRMAVQPYHAAMTRQ